MQKHGTGGAKSWEDLWRSSNTVPSFSLWFVEAKWSVHDHSVNKLQNKGRRLGSWLLGPACSCFSSLPTGLPSSTEMAAHQDEKGGYQFRTTSQPAHFTPRQTPTESKEMSGSLWGWCLCLAPSRKWVTGTFLVTKCLHFFFMTVWGLERRKYWG